MATDLYRAFRVNREFNPAEAFELTKAIVAAVAREAGVVNS